MQQTGLENPKIGYDPKVAYLIEENDDTPFHANRTKQIKPMVGCRLLAQIVAKTKCNI